MLQNPGAPTEAIKKANDQAPMDNGNAGGSYAKALLKKSESAPPGVEQVEAGMEKEAGRVMADEASAKNETGKISKPPPGFVPMAKNKPDGVDVDRVEPETTPAPPEPVITKENNKITNKNAENNKHEMPTAKTNKNLKMNDTAAAKHHKHQKENNHDNNKHTIPQANYREDKNYNTKKSSQEQQIPATAMMPQFYPAHPTQMMTAAGGAQPMPVVYMMPTAAPGQFQPVMAPAPPGWQMATPQGVMAPVGYQQMAPGMAYAPVQHVQYFQEVPVHYATSAAQPQKYHGHKRGSVGNNYDPTFNPLKNNQGKRNHSNNSGSHGSHSTSTTHNHHHNKDKKKNEKFEGGNRNEQGGTVHKKNKSLQSSNGCSDSANKSNNSRTNSSGSDLSLGCSASQNGSSARCMRSCSHDSGVSHKTPPSDTNTSQGRINSQHSCDGKTTVNEVETGERNLSVNSDGTPRRRFSNQTEFKKPDQELVKKIIDLIEFYLSDEYLAKDKYLLRQIRCKSEGYISIKLMTSFKKVKKLTRDWRTVRYALLKSKNLEISPEGFRVKRASALPDALRKPRLLSSVVSIRLPLEYQSVDAITQLFSKYGEIGLVRLLKPGKEIPSDLRNYATQVPDIGKSLCAVVDFEQSDAALQAVRCLKEKLNESGMRLALLGPRVRRTLYKQDRADDTNSIKSDECCEKEQDLEETEENSTSKKADEPSEAGATTETPETEVENNAEAKQGSESVVAGAPVDEKNALIAQKPVAKENLKIKSKVSIILREPKCPSPLNNGFQQVRTTAACQ